MQNPNEFHWEVLQRVFFYFKGISNKGLTYKRSAENLIDYIDVDWAEDRDIKKSISGCIFLMQEISISWRLKRQECVALLIAEVEYIAATEAIKEALFLKEIMNTLLFID
jgi:hypothetical protein